MRVTGAVPIRIVRTVRCEPDRKHCRGYVVAATRCRVICAIVRRRRCRDRVCATSTTLPVRCTAKHITAGLKIGASTTRLCPNSNRTDRQVRNLLLSKTPPRTSSRCTSVPRDAWNRQRKNVSESCRAEREHASHCQRILRLELTWRDHSDMRSNKYHCGNVVDHADEASHAKQRKRERRVGGAMENWAPLPRVFHNTASQDR